MSSKIGLLIDPKILRIVQLFLKKEDELFHLQKISQEAKVPLGSTFRLIKEIENTGLIDTITVGKTKLYKTNKEMAKEFKMLR
jgi:predicted transcriptional regulator